MRASSPEVRWVLSMCRLNRPFKVGPGPPRGFAPVWRPLAGDGVLVTFVGERTTAGSNIVLTFVRRVRDPSPKPPDGDLAA